MEEQIVRKKKHELPLLKRREIWRWTDYLSTGFQCFVIGKRKEEKEYLLLPHCLH